MRRIRFSVSRRCVLLRNQEQAFVSDQAWKICELAIQVHGGVGYTDAYPVEQNARDVKIKLAEEIVARFHGEEAAASAHRAASGN